MTDNHDTDRDNVTDGGNQDPLTEPETWGQIVISMVVWVAIIIALLGVFFGVLNALMGA